MSALHEAVEQINLSRVRLLLRQGADLNAKDRYNYTPLHKAVLQARGSSPQSLLDIVETLLQAKADPNAVDEVNAGVKEVGRMVGEVVSKRGHVWWLGCCMCACVCV